MNIIMFKFKFLCCSLNYKINYFNYKFVLDIIKNIINFKLLKNNLLNF